MTSDRQVKTGMGGGGGTPRIAVTCPAIRHADPVSYLESYELGITIRHLTIRSDLLKCVNNQSLVKSCHVI